MRIIVKYPTRSRPEQAKRCLAEMTSRLSGKHDVRFIVVQDDDDPSKWAVDDPRCVYYFGSHACKIAACNAFTPPIREWDILVMGSDDMWANVDGWDDVIASDMLREFPNLDGFIHYHDGNQPRLCTYPIMGANWYAKCGYVYDPSYLSLFADNEAHETASNRGRLYSDPTKTVFRHEHPAYVPFVVNDGLYRKNDAEGRGDGPVYHERRAKGFGWPDVALSVCICSIRERAHLLWALLGRLNSQINADVETARRVEVVLEIDDGACNGGLSVGAKRARCLKRSIGEYVCFIDDDDAIGGGYIARILAALNDSPDAVGFVLARVGPDTSNVPELYSHGGDDALAPGCYHRSINHLNPVRRTIALDAGFDDVSWGEDSGYSGRISGAIQRTAFIGGQPMYVYHDCAWTSRTRQHAPKNG